MTNLLTKRKMVISFLLTLAAGAWTLDVGEALAQRAAQGVSTAVMDVEVRVNAPNEMARLLKEVDADNDKKITVDDLHSRNSMSTTSTFWLQDLSHTRYEVSGVYFLSNLLQELKLASDRKLSVVHGNRIFENPVHRISRSIRETYWDNLTRRVDAEHLAQVLEDTKLPKSEWRYLYVPATDPDAFAYFKKAAQAHPEWRVRVQKLPMKIEEANLQTLEGTHGLLPLALQKGPSGKLEGVPFVVPGGRFNEMYGWDSYFESLGLLVDGRLDLAKAMVDNFVYEIEHYGKILNANRTYYLNRSQPPFLTSMIGAVYSRMDRTPANRKWLAHALEAAIREYQNVWMNPAHLTPTGLSRYAGSGRGIPPEVEAGHFDYILGPAAKRHGLSVEQLKARYNSGELKDPELDEFFAQDLAVRESGHDTTYRWRVNGRDRAADFVTVDLNSLLYKYELDIARIIKAEFGDSFKVAGIEGASTSQDWLGRARTRKNLMRKYLWNPARQMFFDYNFVNQTRSQYVSATSFYPLWAQEPGQPATRILDEKEGVACIRALLKELEQPGGLSSTSRASLEKYGDRRVSRQWEYPNGWAPHQIIAWGAIKNYGLTKTADRLVYKWLYTITRNAADFNGTVPEKYDVVKRSHAVFAEYGNVGTQFSYITQEGFGWMNASYQVGLQLLSEPWKPQLEALRPPEWLPFE